MSKRKPIEEKNREWNLLIAEKLESLAAGIRAGEIGSMYFAEKVEVIESINGKIEVPTHRTGVESIEFRYKVLPK